jgi:hypothetical protein
VSPDREWVREELFPALQAAGLRPLLDVQDFVPGRDLTLEMDRAGQSSRRILCVLTPAYFEDDRMVSFEALNARRSDPSGQRGTLVPLLLQPTKLPKWIDGLVPVDWTDANARSREWRKLLKVLGAPRLDTPPPGARQDATPAEQATSPPRSTWRPRMILMKVNRRVLIPYAVYALLLLAAIGAALWSPANWQTLPVVNRVSPEAWAHGMPVFMKALACSLVGIFLLIAIGADLMNMQIVFSMVKMFFLLAFFTFLCGVVTLISHENMIPHVVLALLLVVALIRHFVHGSLGYYWKRQALGDTTAEAVLLVTFLVLIFGPLRTAF